MKCQSPTLHLAELADAEPIARMSRDLVEVGLGWSWTPDRVRRSIQCPDTVVLSAHDGPRMRGFAIMEFLDEEAHLELLAVDPSYRRAGLGRRIVRWLEESCTVAGSFVVYLELRASNPGARAFYQALGYRSVAHVPRYYQGIEAAIRMARDLSAG